MDTKMTRKKKKNSTSISLQEQRNTPHPTHPTQQPYPLVSMVAASGSSWIHNDEEISYNWQNLHDRIE